MSTRTALLRLALGLLAGGLFGFGLALSGMIDPARVLGFLTLGSGAWDPSLMFVLGGAVGVATLGVGVGRRLSRPAFDDHFALPPTTGITRRLLLGAALFGIGWGLAGFCPGPAIAGLSLGLAPVAIFVGAMAIGMIVHDRFFARR
ncbi:YeeE/YedE family protein [Rhodospirillum rubrum]|uniref:Twin-arginine translocation pathway signal n=1 Tax=Rhodospirillum rubrum (strain ATCC 11170 / ATH 1.1.1 / DSM 467 / LMG 4362 / NCIMB 8255 / S1) TaxID=269796 RepID=Q2RTN0_RHORT|nr:YeeE/YedE family protein [Rhodospirillum rubrum]ABC22515.1 Twin-arginine translocation pathway signal [Rhodospirillum rubrum ATCC 11170]AEO48232.1 twin-arginine translocation pathway signal [Rhodospirillum rubrum F11]MBK5954103.1 hypothetical protein [Rhodospirillum rubrum]QXG82144.1 YeeE/YedE family protein [Rhodospirillum rubrum]HAQ00430.1 YeeE/YedE family protein [Rhodospirillum rubrum]